MNFNNILVGITLLISLITLYTIYNVNNNMDKLLLDTDSDDLDGNKQRLSIIKYTGENNIKLNSLQRIVGQNSSGIKVIIDMLKSMMKFNVDNFRGLNKNQTLIKNDIDNMRDNVKFIERRQRKDADEQYRLIERIATGRAQGFLGN